MQRIHDLIPQAAVSTVEEQKALKPSVESQKKRKIEEINRRNSGDLEHFGTASNDKQLNLFKKHLSNDVYNKFETSQTLDLYGALQIITKAFNVLVPIFGYGIARDDEAQRILLKDQLRFRNSIAHLKTYIGENGDPIGLPDGAKLCNVLLSMAEISPVGCSEGMEVGKRIVDKLECIIGGNMAVIKFPSNSNYNISLTEGSDGSQVLRFNLSSVLVWILHGSDWNPSSDIKQDDAICYNGIYVYDYGILDVVKFVQHSGWYSIQNVSSEKSK